MGIRRTSSDERRSVTGPLESLRSARTGTRPPVPGTRHLPRFESWNPFARYDRRIYVRGNGPMIGSSSGPRWKGLIRDIELPQPPARGFVIGFDYQIPTTVDETVGLLSEHGYEAKLLAGGQSLLVLLRQRLVAPKVIIGLSRVTELKGLQSNGSLVIGSMTRYKDVADSVDVRSQLPLLSRAAGSVGSVHIRNRGTVGGALAHNDPSGDVPTALLTLGASYLARSVRGSSTYESRDFSIGIFETRLAEDELLVSIEVPAQPDGATFGYRRFSYREGEYPMVVASCRLEWESGRCHSATVAVGGADAFPKRLLGLEAALAGFDFGVGSLKDLVYDAAAPEINVAPDIRGGVAWKQKVVVATIHRALDEATRSEGAQVNA